MAQIFIELQLAARRLGNDIAAAKFYFSERRRAYMERLARPAFVAPDEARGRRCALPLSRARLSRTTRRAMAQVRASGFCMSRSHVSLGLIAAALAVRYACAACLRHTFANQRVPCPASAPPCISQRALLLSSISVCSLYVAYRAHSLLWQLLMRRRCCRC